MLDSSRYAWGDLARTLDQPRNQIRMLQASWESMCRTMGSLFMGVVAKIIPYINALTEQIIDILFKLSSSKYD